MVDFYQFGIEIEMIADPHKIRDPLDRSVYYERLAQALRNSGVRARADDCRGQYRKHTEEYSRGWWITRDGSLASPSHPGSECIRDIVSGNI